jgi:hypothetical protein
MKLLKALINSLLCGLFFCVLLTLLFADLNINSRLDLFFLGRLALVLFITYGLIVACLGLAVFGIYTFFSSRKNIALVSPTFLSLGFSFLSLVFLLIFRGNTVYFQSFFGVSTLTLLRHQLTALVSLTLAGFLACFFFYRYRRRRLVFIAYFLVWAGLLGYTFSQRPDNSFPAPPKKLMALETRNSGKKVTILELEGLSFDFIIPLISQDKLPNFSLLVEQGSWGRLESFTPNDALILDSSFNTGKYPARHRQVSPFTYRVGSIKQELEIIPRFLFFRQLVRTGLLTASPNTPPYRPKDIWQIFSDGRMRQVRRDDPGSAEVSRPAAKTDTVVTFNLFYRDLQNDPNPIFAEAKQAFFRDCLYAETAFQERVASVPQVYGLHLDGLNVAEKYFYRYSFPDLFGNVSSEDVTKYGSVIERYYKFYDEIIGKYLTSLKEDELLIVFSPHGIEPLPFWKRVVEWVSGNTEISAFHELAPEGAVFFYGKSINREKNIEGMRLVDIAPTLLYYLGLPVGKDMDGIVRSSLFVWEFISDNPIMTISSYEDYALKPGPQVP